MSPPDFDTLLMKIFSGLNSKVAVTLKRGGVGVIPTDTIYGIVGSAFSQKAVSRIYRLRRRRPDKPMIVLVSSKKELKHFGISLDRNTNRILAEIWPGKVSVILPISDKRLALRSTHLHRGTKTLAFRLPAQDNLRKLLKKTGPLVAPSANIEGRPPAKTIKEAQKYFGRKVDFYVDAGKVVSRPSALIKLAHGKISVLRKGGIRIASYNRQRGNTRI